MVLKRVGKISILLIVVLLLFAACSKPASQPLTAQDFLDLGEKYLLDLDYEQALVQFLKAIEIDPMNPRGYTGAAEAYVGLGDISNAISVLEQGLRATNDRDIESRIQELHDIQEDSQNSSSQEQTESPTNADTTIPTDNTGADSTAEPDINTYGNSSDNIKNGGLAAIQGDHIYYIGNSMFNIHSMKVDGNDIRQLNDSPSFLINVIGDWIYYVSPDDSWNNFQIYKMKLDGSEQEMISDDSTFYMIVVGERIYYINNSDGNSIYRINIDGSNRIKLNDDPTDCFVVLDGLMIFYYTRGNNHEQQGSTVTYVDSG
ncbi:MAG: DUF5050 domain-containing protein, partial [Oscillospiraceae bacterium]|nr:DUF5050 domain-containing protein [Oscillospiraceae bacterium]